MKLVQFLTYGDLHLPVGPWVAGPPGVYPLFAVCPVIGKATAPHPVCAVPIVSPEKFKFSIRHPLLTQKTSFSTFWGSIVTNLISSPVIDTSVLKPIGLFSTYLPGRILIVSPSSATAAAAPTVALASPSKNPLLLSSPSFDTQIVFWVSTPDGLHDTPDPTDDNR